jgi:hypothetical protein
MCLAIYKPADTAPDWKAYECGFDNNSDSWGFAVVLDGKLITRYGLGKWEQFREAFEPFSQCQAVIHFRLATHGKTDIANCHPFMVSDDIAMIHNGIVSIERNVNTNMSDTWHFCELVCKPMHMRDPDFFLRNEVSYTQEMAHKGSKFCFLRADGSYAIWNADDGEWEKDGHWYSNTSYERPRYYGVSWGYYSQSSSLRDMAPCASPKTEAKLERSPFRTGWDYEAADTVDEAGVEVERITSEADDSGDEVEDDGDWNGAYTDLRMQDLMAFGFSRKALDEVFELLGHCGIEALHDEM